MTIENLAIQQSRLAAFYANVAGWMFIDPGVNTGMCAPRPGAGVLQISSMKAYKKAPRYRPALLDSYHVAITDQLRRRNISTVVVEGYLFNAKVSSPIKFEMGAIIRLVCGQLRIPVVEMAPMTWKSLTFNGSKGSSAQKQEYVRRANQWIGVETITDIDQADAALMAYAVALIMNEPDRRSKGIDRFRKELSVARTYTPVLE